MYVFLYVCMYVCMYVCIYIYMFTYLTSVSDMYFNEEETASITSSNRFNSTSIGFKCCCGYVGMCGKYACMCMCMYIYVCIYIRVHLNVSAYHKLIYQYTCLHANMYTSIHPYIHAYIHTYIHTYIHIYTHTHIHTYTHTHIHTYIYAYAPLDKFKSIQFHSIFIHITTSWQFLNPENQM